MCTNERDMGTEYDYEGIYEGVCPGCGKDIFAKIESYEYPAGTLEFSGNQVFDGITVEDKLELILD